MNIYKYRTLDVDKFDKILKLKQGYDGFQNTVLDEDGYRVRSLKMFVSDTHFDWNRNDENGHYNKLEWDNKNKIWKYSYGFDKQGDFYINDINSIVIVGKREGKYHSLSYKIINNEKVVISMIGKTEEWDGKREVIIKDNDFLDSYKKFLKNVDKLKFKDERVVEIIKKTAVLNGVGKYL